MKQVIFAIALLAMASLTGCLTDDESSVDETTDTTSDNTGNTNDNSETNQDNTDSGDDGMFDPVGTNGVTIPEDSSVFMDTHGIYTLGEWRCDGEVLEERNENGVLGEDLICKYYNYEEDSFVNSYNEDGTLNSIDYIDSDGISNGAHFNGWINKTGNIVTIEGLKYPDRGPTINYWQTYTSFEYMLVNKPVNSSCNYQSICEVIFYGHNGLTYSGTFTLSDASKSWSYSIDVNGDGIWGNIPEGNEAADEMHNMHKYAHHTATFNLPFEPYGFSIINEYGSADRAF